PRGARGAQPRGAVHPRAWADRRPPRLRAHAGAPRPPLRRRHEVELSGPGPEAVEALPRLTRSLEGRPPRPRVTASSYGNGPLHGEIVERSITFRGLAFGGDAGAAS